MLKYFVHFLKIGIIWSSFLTISYAQNYVELGAGRTPQSENFEQVTEGTISEDFQIPVYEPALRQELVNKQIRKVPRYNFGRERKLQRKQFKWQTGKYKLIRSYDMGLKKLPSIWKRMKVVKEFKLKKAGAKGLKIPTMNPEVATVNDVNSIEQKSLPNVTVDEKNLFLRQPKDLELLAVDILFEERESCEEVVPVSQFLLDKKTNDARIKYYRATCLHKAKLYSESIPLLSEVIGSGSDHYAQRAVEIILDELPKGYEGIVAKSLAPKDVYKRLNQKQKDKYNYILAKGQFENQNYKKAERSAKRVSSNSPDYEDARFIEAISQYMSGRIPVGIKTLLSLKSDIEPKVERTNQFLSLVNITLGRFYFERGAYKKSIESYNLVDKNHPLWMDSLIEKGWAQIKLEDYSGAIGNMFTVHSPFFKDAFIPESYVIRTIGYLNLCQFGDAHSTLSILELGYPAELKKVQDYLAKEPEHYATLMNYLDSDPGKGLAVDGLPPSIVREMGRDRDYLVVQTKLNDIVDEIPLFKNFASSVMAQRRKLVKKIEKLAEESKSLRLKEAESLKDKRADLAQDYKKRRQVVFEEGKSLQYRIDTFDKGIIEYKQANGNAVKRAELLRDEFLVEAEKRLQQSLQNIEVRLTTVLRNNDLLRYEVYANSGKNIRFQVAGGKVQKGSREPAKDKKSNDYNWEFKGEFWQDEIGNFRSDLKSLCPR